jgi:2-polyprenyl-3-methyl-5-hydroxy-6-metoxy-1,4-benzoquinol methylase
MKEHEIRPEKLLERYVELSARDAENCFADASHIDTVCVACGENRYKHEFEKTKFAYTKCLNCGTLFQNPRPPIEAFEVFYRQSESSKYWAEVFFPAVAEIRREKIFRHRVKQLSQICFEKNVSVETLIDVGAGYGIFLEEWQHKFPSTQSIANEPSASLAEECRAKGFVVAEDIVENITEYNNSADLVTCFEVLEHVHNPIDFINTLKNLAKPGGYIFISTLCIDGFDLQVLWDKSSQISPPHHINFLSIQGFEALFESAGLTNISITTPGQLDVDIIRNAVKRDPSILDEKRFLSELLADDNKAQAFQKFLVDQKLSSHVWVIGQKPHDAEASK